MDKDKIKEIFGDDDYYNIDNVSPESDINYCEVPQEELIKERIIINYLRLASKERKEMLNTLIRLIYTK